MNRPEKVIYTANVHTTGGRTGASRSDDGHLDVKLSRPGTAGTGTNPEQLFAAGWSACFQSAMELVAHKMKVALPATRRAMPRSTSDRTGKATIWQPGSTSASLAWLQTSRNA